MLCLPLLLLAGCTAGDPAEPSVPAGAEAATSRAPRDQMTFTFTGDAGDPGCRYDGPGRVRTDALSTMVNESDGVAFVTLARLADGAGPDDFQAYLDTLGDTYPVRVPAADHDPAVHSWMDGGWRQVHTTLGGGTHTVTSTTFAEGDYVMFCFREVGGGASDLWPLGHVTVADG